MAWRPARPDSSRVTDASMAPTCSCWGSMARRKSLHLVHDRGERGQALFDGDNAFVLRFDRLAHALDVAGDVGQEGEDVA